MKECGNKKKEKFLQKAHIDERIEFYSQNNQHFSGVKVRISNCPCESLQKPFRTAAKDQQSTCDAQSEDCAQKELTSQLLRRRKGYPRET